MQNPRDCWISESPLRRTNDVDRWTDEELEDPFDIYITRGRHPSGKIRLIQAIRVFSPSLKIWQSANNSIVIMGTSVGGSAATTADKHIYIQVPGITREEIVRKKKINVKLNEEDIGLIYANGEIHAFQAKCPHAGGPLHQGDIEDLAGQGLCIKCPWHSWQFNLKTGECVFPGNRPNQKLHIFPVKVTNNEVRIGFDQIAPKYFKTPPS